MELDFWLFHSLVDFSKTGHLIERTPLGRLNIENLQDRVHQFAKRSHQHYHMHALLCMIDVLAPAPVTF
jgi:hypothetical protein